MRRLADISVFENLQARAHRDAGIVSDVAVFNGDFTIPVVQHMREWVSKNPDRANNALNVAREAGFYLGSRVFYDTVYGGSRPAASGMPSNYSDPAFYRLSPKEQNTYLRKECTDLSNALSAELNIHIASTDLMAFALSSATGYNYDIDEINSPHRSEFVDVAREYGA